MVGRFSKTGPSLGIFPNRGTATLRRPCKSIPELTHNCWPGVGNGDGIVTVQSSLVLCGPRVDVGATACAPSWFTRWGFKHMVAEMSEDMGGSSAFPCWARCCVCVSEVPFGHHSHVDVWWHAAYI